MVVSILVSFSSSASFKKLAKLVAGPGIEPGTGAYETPVLPLHYPAIILKFGGQGETRTLNPLGAGF